MLRSKGRMMCITTDEALVICPPLTEKGDQLVLFRGVRVPFIVRATQTRPHYRLIGPCYLHRPMYQEEARTYLEDEQELQEFHVD